jgi:hypothetical protein
MNDSDRKTSIVWTVGGVAWVINGIVGLPAAVGTSGFYAAEVIWIAVHALVLVGIIGLRRSGATGQHRWGTAGLTLAAIGRILFIAFEIASIALGSDDLPVFPLAVVSTGIGMTLGGAAIASAGRGRRWSRFAPLAMGAYPFLVIVPVFAATGARPPDVLVAGWGVTIAAVGAAIAADHRRVPPSS